MQLKMICEVCNPANCAAIKKEPTNDMGRGFNGEILFNQIDNLILSSVVSKLIDCLSSCWPTLRFVNKGLLVDFVGIQNIFRFPSWVLLTTVICSFCSVCSVIDPFAHTEHGNWTHYRLHNTNTLFWTYWRNFVVETTTNNTLLTHCEQIVQIAQQKHTLHDGLCRNWSNKQTNNMKHSVIRIEHLNIPSRWQLTIWQKLALLLCPQ